MERHNQIANLQVVFSDVEKYSKRRTLTQISVIDALTRCMKEALAAVSKKYIHYAQSNNLNFQTDIISLPTGDGAATIFSFDGLHDIHLSFALSLLESAQRSRQAEPCQKFQEEGWCNCHPYFNLRIGVSEGKGIVFTDLRDQFNVAGGVVNMAARVMGLADRNQIMFTEEAYKQLVDMVDNPQLVDLFIEFDDIELKHNVKIKAYQFADKAHSFLNCNPPADLTLKRRVMAAMEKMRAAGLPLPPTDLPESAKAILVEQMEKMVAAFAQLGKPAKPTLAIEAQVIEGKPNKADAGDGK